jgi:hypothetical protein
VLTLAGGEGWAHEVVARRTLVFEDFIIYRLRRRVK